MSVPLTLFIAGLIVLGVIEGIALLCTGLAMREKDQLIRQLQDEKGRATAAGPGAYSRGLLREVNRRRPARRKIRLPDDDWPSHIG